MTESAAGTGVIALAINTSVLTYQATLSQLVADRVASRITALDASLWGPDAAAEAAIRLSWTGLAQSSRPLLAEIAVLRTELLAEGLDRVVLAGMGGSSLAPEVICNTAGVALTALDTTDAGQVAAALATDLHRTVLVVSSKSGGTVETDSHRRVYEQAFTHAGLDPTRHIVVVTDPGSPLSETAAKAGYRKVFHADPNVGGRYSALTAFGLVPSGLAGVDISALLDDAAAIATELVVDSTDNPGLQLGALLGAAHNSGADKVVFADFGSGIVGFGDWAEQLIAESTGKLGKGILPVVTEGPNAHGFADACQDATLVQLGAEGASVTPAAGSAVRITGPLGAQFLCWEYAIAIAGRVIGIDPFDQPDVEEAKKQARAFLDAPADDAPTSPDFVDGSIEVFASGLDLAGTHTVTDVLELFIASAPELGYIAVQAYLDRFADASAAQLRALLAAKSGLQTTFGWGPRFLHSTGQYHKGGHPNGIFLQITGAVDKDLAIPDRPYTFGVLQAAQAAGDGNVLLARNRPLIRMHLTNREAGLRQLLNAL